VALTLLNLAVKCRAAQRQALARPGEETAMVRAAAGPALFTLGGDSEDARFKRITSPSTLRDLNPLMHERMQQVCFYLSVTAPFAKRIVELLTDYVVGDGFKAIAETPEVQQVIDRFWKDSVNDLKRNVGLWSSELSIFGELCLPAAVNPVDGFTRLGYIDPQEIESVEYGLLQTGDGAAEISIPIAVHLKRRLGESLGRRLNIIRREEDPFSPTFGHLSGDCFYTAINKAKSASRGISDLFCLADWLDVLDQIVFDGADRARFMNAWIWHYIVKGADESKVEEFQKLVTKSPPRQGGVQVTNDQVEIKPMNPDFKSAEYDKILTNLKYYGLGGIGFPSHWFADPSDANRATAAEMGQPTLKKLAGRQNVLKSLVTDILDFALSAAADHGVLAARKSSEPAAGPAWKLEAPELSIRDLAKAATIMQTSSNALAAAEDRGWIRGETAARAFHLTLKEMGVEVDSQKEFSEAQQEKSQRDAEAIEQFAPQRELASELARQKAEGRKQKVEEGPNGRVQ
jgi:hypothetical protein